MTTVLRLFAVAASLACASPSFAIESGKVAQESTSDRVLMAYFWQGDLAQSFIQFADNITGAGVRVNGTENKVSISLWTNLPNNGGKMLASGESTDDGEGWVDVFWPKVTIEPDSPYYLVFSGTPDTSGLRGDTENPYPYGNVFAGSGYAVRALYDYAFRTYSEAAPVPEPATWMSLLAGLAVCAGGVSRRRS